MTYMHYSLIYKAKKISLFLEICVDRYVQMAYIELIDAMPRRN